MSTIFMIKMFTIICKHAVNVSYSLLRMTHPSRNFFVLCFMHVCMAKSALLESPVNKVFQKKKLVNSKTI